MASPFNKEIADKILERIAEGESVKKITYTQREDGYPSQFTFYGWLLDAEKEGASEELKDFAKRYVRAREIQAEIAVDECMEIADNASDDIQLLDNGDNAKLWIKQTVINRAKLQIDTRRWLIEILRPKKYGKKTQEELPFNTVVIKDYTGGEYESDD